MEGGAHAQKRHQIIEILIVELRLLSLGKLNCNI
jgi:hypothetical protein